MDFILNTFKRLLLILLGLWGILTLVVIVALIDKWSNPNWKGISNADLVIYYKLTFCALCIFIVFKILKRLSNKNMNKGTDKFD